MALIVAIRASGFDYLQIEVSLSRRRLGMQLRLFLNPRFQPRAFTKIQDGCISRFRGVSGSSPPLTTSFGTSAFDMSRGTHPPTLPMSSRMHHFPNRPHPEGLFFAVRITSSTRSH